MNAIHRTIARTRRRLWLTRAARWSGRVVVALLAAALLVVLLHRVAGVSVPEIPAFIGLTVAAAIVVIVGVFVPRRSDEQLAHLLDERLGLKDRLGTALYFANQPGVAWNDFLRQDAEKAAAAADVNKALPVAAGASWKWATPLAAVAALAFAFVPAGLDLFGLQEERQREQQEQQAEARQEQEVDIQRAIIRDLDAAERELREQDDPQKLMDELASLTQREMLSPELRNETASRLSDLSERLEQEQQQKTEELQSLKNQMSRLDPEQPGPADRFADALRRGDFDAAQQELERLSGQMQNMSPEQRQALQNQLNNMARQLQQMAEQQQQQQKQAQQQIEQQLRDAGLSQQQIQQLQQQNYNQQAVQQALQQQGMSQQQAQQTAQQIQKQQQQSKKQGRARASPATAAWAARWATWPTPFRRTSSRATESRQQQGQQGQQGQQQGQQQGPGSSGSAGPAGQHSQFQQGQWSGQQQLQQMSQMQQQLQQMQQAQGQAQQAMQTDGRRFRGSSNRAATESAGTARRGRGGKQWGTGTDPNVLGAERAPGQHNVRSSSDAQNRPGPIITSWTTQRDGGEGEAGVELDTAVSEARNAAERSVTEDRVPKRFHKTVRDYFQPAPRAAEEQRRRPVRQDDGLRGGFRAGSGVRVPGSGIPGLAALAGKFRSRSQRCRPPPMPRPRPTRTPNPTPHAPTRPSRSTVVAAAGRADRLARHAVARGARADPQVDGDRAAAGGADGAGADARGASGGAAARGPHRHGGGGPLRIGPPLRHAARTERRGAPADVVQGRWTTSGGSDAGSAGRRRPQERRPLRPHGLFRPPPARGHAAQGACAPSRPATLVRRRHRPRLRRPLGHGPAPARQRGPAGPDQRRESRLDATGESERDVLAAAREAGAAGIPVDVAPVRYAARSEVLVEAVYAPTQARQGRTVGVRVALRATVPPPARCSCSTTRS